MRRVFVDTNVLLDLLLERNEYAAAAALFNLGDRGQVALVTSTLSLANAHYVIAKLTDRKIAIRALRQARSFFSLAAVTDTDFDRALASDAFDDFEDALQHEVALAADCDTLVTRNLKDFRGAQLATMTAAAYVASAGL